MSPKSLSNYTTLHVGGPAQKLIRATTEAELISAIDEADSNNQPLLILGGGSNVLVGDQGFQGTVVLVETRGNSYEIDACSGGQSGYFHLSGLNVIVHLVVVHEIDPNNIVC